MDSIVDRSLSTAARAGYTGSNGFAPWSRTVAFVIVVNSDHERITQ